MSQKAVLRIVAARSGGQCERCSGKGHSLHHLKNRSQGGQWSPSNCVWLCGDGTRGCHGWATSHPTAAWTEGFHVKPWERPGARPIMSQLHGVVLLADDGGVIPFEGAAA